jgi:hypothetical protein
MKDHELAELTNELTSIAQLYGRTQQLRERISYCLKEHLEKANVLEGKLKPTCDHREGEPHNGAMCLKPKISQGGQDDASK